MTNLSIPIQLDRFQSDSDVWDDDDAAREPSNWEKGTGLYQRALRAGREEGREEGLLQGLRRSLQLLLDARPQPPSDRVRASIDACESREQLEAWLVRASRGELLG